MSLQVVKYSRKVKRVSLQRFIVSKIVYEPNKVKLPVDLYVLYDNQLWLEQKSLQDKEFHSKFGSSLEVLSKILKEITFTTKFSTKALNRMSQRLKNHMESFLVPIRNYKAFKSKFGGCYQLDAAKQPGVEKKHLPQQTRIGKGYRDKGTLKNPAKDGSPSWQEVASRAGQTALVERRIKNANNWNELERAFKEYFDLK